MKILLVLVLIMADGPKQTALEMPTLEECWIRAQAVTEKADTDKMSEAGVGGHGAGCIVIHARSRDIGR
jgi:hypothetical protein